VRKYALDSNCYIDAAEGALDLATMPRGFVFDVLIAFSCREAGVVLITRNVRDMERIRSVFRFEFVAPFPPPARP
jgi:predicted nucleic acid-binding protein